MKIFIISVFAIFMTTEVFSADMDPVEMQEHIKETMGVASEDCKKESGVSQEIIDKAQNGELEKDFDLTHYFLCYYRRLGVTTFSGRIIEGMLKLYLNIELEGKTKEQIEEAHNDCKNIKSTLKVPYPPLIAFDLAECIAKYKKI